MTHYRHHHHHQYHRNNLIDRLAALLAPVRDAGLGPLRAHRSGHDHDHGADGDSVDMDDVLAAYREQAEALHERLVHDRGLHVVELLGATGSGKTRLLEELVDRVPDDERVGVLVGDVAGDDDASRLRAHGVQVHTVNTGKECHLDPSLVEDGLESLDLDSLDRLYVENVGNMVCPADFPLGAQARICVVSTTEGDDVVRKHPLLFQAIDAVVVNKTDVAAAVDVNVDTIVGDVERIAPGLPVFTTSAKTGHGLPDLAAYLDRLREEGHDHDHHHHDEVPTTDGGRSGDGECSGGHPGTGAPERRIDE